MALIHSRQGHSHYLFNNCFFESAPTGLFTPPAQNTTNSLGRGTAYLIHAGGVPAVMRLYRRGGLMRHLIKSSYFYGGLNQTRMWREMQILEWIQTQQLPAPEPLAAHCQVIAGVLYRGALITRQIPNAQTLAERAQQGPLTPKQWRHTGQTIARFHRAGVYHADLNANNIMLNKSGEVFLIDFDKACRKTPASGWQQDNLERLLRSLHKQQRLLPRFYFDDSDWQGLLNGYSKG